MQSAWRAASIRTHPAPRGAGSLLGRRTGAGRVGDTKIGRWGGAPAAGAAVEATTLTEGGHVSEVEIGPGGDTVPVSVPARDPEPAPSRASAPQSSAPRSRLRPWLLFLGLPALLAVLASQVLVPAATWGWDEVMHAELPAARMVVHSQLGEPSRAFDVLLECDRYPFVWPLVLAASQGLFGVGEPVARATGWLAFTALLGLLGLLASRVCRRLDSAHIPARRTELDSAHIGVSDANRGVGAGIVALLLAAASPMLLGFGPLLFLELPAAASIALVLVAWLAAWERPASTWRGLIAGATLALAFFTKFNYGAMIGATLALDAALRLLPQGGRGPRLRLAASCAVVPVLALSWWFVLPLPGGFAAADAHREAFGAWMRGNQEGNGLGATWRAIYFVGLFAGSPIQAALLVGGALATLRWALRPLVRTLWLAALGMLLPVLLHPFHLERFFLPAAAPCFALAGVGWAALLRSLRPRVGLLVVALPTLVGIATAPASTVWFAGLLGFPPDPANRPAVRAAVEGWSSPNLAERAVVTAGLDRAAANRLLDALADVIGPEERVGWVGGANELPPGALHLGLLARGGGARRFLEADPWRALFHNGPEASFPPETMLDWAQHFDVLVFTDPPDLKGRRNQEFQREFQRVLLEQGGWRAEPVIELDVPRPPGAPLRLAVSVARR
jgi:hypothetical protein